MCQTLHNLITSNLQQPCDHRRRRRPNIRQTLSQNPVLAGLYVRSALTKNVPSPLSHSTVAVTIIVHQRHFKVYDEL